MIILILSLNLDFIIAIFMPFANNIRIGKIGLSLSDKHKRKKLTREQKEIVRTSLKKNDILKIFAFAGTGKTTTLASYALNRPSQKFLYIAFNKSMQLDARNKFPSNVHCRTIHSLAFPSYGKIYKHKIGNPRVHIVADALEFKRYDTVKTILDTVHNFLVSPAEKITEKHIPSAYRNSIHSKNGPDIVDYANKIWEMMQDDKNEEMPMPHDGYLKLFQLSHPKLKFDGILLDEAQDTNPVTSAILNEQNTARILVGDPHQQIYGFRGAIDAMEQLNSTQTCYLTHSFRFNQTIASLANKLLHSFKGELHRIKGIGEYGDMGKVKPPYTIISRTNAGLFDEAVVHYRKYSLAYLGTQGLTFKAIEDAYQLSRERPDKVKDSFLKRFNDLESLKEYAKSVDDFELLSLCKVTDTYKDTDIPNLIKRIKRKTIKDPAKADIILTTTHKAKGLEFDHVKMVNDFIPLVKDDSIIEVQMADPEEINLLYVSITRTKKCLNPNDDLEDFIQMTGS